MEQVPEEKNTQVKNYTSTEVQFPAQDENQTTQNKDENGHELNIHDQQSTEHVKKKNPSWRAIDIVSNKPNPHTYVKVY